MIKLVIFDYDGLLVESETIAFIAEEKILQRCGKPLSKELFEKYLGYSVRDTLDGYISYHKLPITTQAFYDEREQMIFSLLETDLVLKPGAIILLDYLRKKKIDTVIGSSGERNYIEAGLKKFGIQHYFKNITCVSEVKRGKPYPDLFLEALCKNNTQPKEAIVLEDTISGITAAKKAKIFCITVPPKTMDIQGHRIADIIADDLGRVKDIFERLRIFNA